MANKKINVLAIIQARTGSSRFPSKVLQKISGKTIVSLIYERLSKSKIIDKTIIATSNDKKDNFLYSHLIKKDIRVFRGSEKNVLDRFYNASLKYKPKWIVRITADCPLIDIDVVDKVIINAKKNNVDLSFNTSPPSFPDGYDAECFSFKALKIAHKYAKKNYEIEHVTPYLRFNKKIKKINYNYKKDYSKLRLTLDTKEDLKVIKKVYSNFYPDIFFGIDEVIKLYLKKLNYLINLHQHLFLNHCLNLILFLNLYQNLHLLNKVVIMN